VVRVAQVRTDSEDQEWSSWRAAWPLMQVPPAAKPPCYPLSFSLAMERMSWKFETAAGILS
jgi:hypothetical protein